MLDCYYCKQNGIARDGGDIGICHECARKKCHRCGKASAGKTLCTNCEYGDQLDRMRGRVCEPWLFPEYSHFNLKVREELAWEAKRHMHEAVEMAARGVVLLVDALWGGFGKPEQKEFPSDKAA